MLARSEQRLGNSDWDPVARSWGITASLIEDSEDYNDVRARHRYRVHLY